MKKRMEIEDLAKIVVRGLDGADKKIEGLAMMVKNSFDHMDERFASLEGRMNNVEDGIDHLKNDMVNLGGRMSDLERELSAIRHHLVYKEEFEDLMSRVKYIESRLKIESGK